MIYLKVSNRDANSHSRASNRLIHRLLFAFCCLIPNQIMASEQGDSLRLELRSAEPFSNVSAELGREIGQSVIRVGDVLNSLDDSSKAAIASDSRMTWDNTSVVIAIDDPQQQFAIAQSIDAETSMHRLTIFLQPRDSELDLNGLSSTGRPSQSALTGAAAYHWLENEKRSNEGASSSLDAKKNILLNTIEASLVGEYK